ncbi:MAG: TIM barrel protein, partial [Pelomonas sp.]|nr:TIM barrel protein [Roseateles sp.]
MPRLAANLSWLYQEHALEKRFEAAAADGFAAVEMLFPYAQAHAAQFGRWLDYAGISCALINAPAGDWAAGERGLAALAGRESDFRASLLLALDYAAAIGCPRVHVMSGVLPWNGDRAAARSACLANLHWAAPQAEGRGITLTIEPINPRDMPGYFLNRQDEALALIDEVGSPALRLQLDAYHCQIVEGDVLAHVRRAFETGVLAHVQVAGVPRRHEPMDDEYGELFSYLDSVGYAGFVGCEYKPRAGTS